MWMARSIIHISIWTATDQSYIYQCKWSKIYNTSINVNGRFVIHLLMWMAADIFSSINVNDQRSIIHMMVTLYYGIKNYIWCLGIDVYDVPSLNSISNPNPYLTKMCHMHQNPFLPLMFFLLIVAILRLVAALSGVPFRLTAGLLTAGLLTAELLQPKQHGIINHYFAIKSQVNTDVLYHTVWRNKGKWQL